ncbi:hypothetical protein GCM10009837_05710 [Streptomyces durmitorensis]|uniref:Secreted protein n=1 Tax=Streptomyces durmitorensis TaxID=319947 RepID=A0ABY4PND0_9ACTN|nr:hypothetical protein [Streptomyces durmitorensis]UQT54528.1 hypothetical protein M4V62_05115 [Streptomyces durmitorensis]
MITAVIIAVVVIAAAAVLFVGLRRARGGGRGLKHRFGPEYDHTVARHDGDVRAAEQELRERVRLHGSVRAEPLPPGARERYVAQWAGVQEQFVESPQQAVTEADALLARLARDRGFPDGEHFDEQVAALSVHHAHSVHGYRRVHTATRGQSGTEEMREAMVEARRLFDALVAEHAADSTRNGRPASAERGNTPWALPRRHAKGSGT